MSCPYRVLHVINDLDIGGAQQYVLKLCKNIDSAQFAMHVAFGGIDRLSSEFSETTGVHRIPLRADGLFRHPLNAVVTVSSILAVIRRYDIEVVHTHLMTSAFWAGIAARLARVPVIYNPMGSLAPRRRIEWLASRVRVINWTLDSTVDLYIAFSQQLKNELVHLRHIPTEKVHFSYIGVDLDEFSSQPDDVARTADIGIDLQAPVVGIVARLSPEKRVNQALLAFATLRTLVPTAQLLIVGDGPCRASLEQLAQELDVADKVVFAGYRRDVARFLALADVYLCTTERPSMGLAVLEAMAMGLPLVVMASDEDEARMAGETVIHGANGYVAHGAPDSLAQRLAELLLDPDKAVRMGKMSRELVQARFSFAQHVKDIQDLYIRFISRKCFLR
jgi:glycosyltransferase involved in cell wall biosynthesis